jgi:hypothetical protein
MNLQMIFKLIQKDFSAYKMRILGVSSGALFMGMIMIFVNTNLDRMFAGSSSFIIITIILPFLPELKDHSVWIQTASLPVSRKAMVASRFLSSLIIAFTNLILWVVVYTVLMEILQSDPQYALESNVVLLVATHILFSLALFYFAYYRLNFMSAIGFYVVSTILPQLIQTILAKTSGFLIEDFDPSLGLLVAAISCCILAFYSSISYFPKRDL